MRKMGSAITLEEWLAQFLLIYRSTPHTTTGMRPDELFLRRRMHTHFSMLSPNLTPRVEKYQQKQKVVHDGKKSLQTFKRGKKVLVLDKCGKTKWLSGTVVEQRSPVTYVVEVGPRKRFCHADHLLHSAVTDVESEQDMDDLPEFTPTTNEPEIAVSTATADSVDMPLPLRHSTQEIRAPRRPIEEL